jgi:AraC-like DNA-binding protein
MGQKLFIKNMVCDRCKQAVRDQIGKSGVNVKDVDLGYAEIESDELIDDKKQKTVERIKNVIIEMVHYMDEPLAIKQSEYISSKLNYDYHYLSKLFSEAENITIEQYIINQKIERIKELLTYGEMNINEIAFKLGYSSVQHLSQQFKKVTGLTPTGYKQQNIHPRKPLDGI